MSPQGGGPQTLCVGIFRDVYHDPVIARLAGNNLKNRTKCFEGTLVRDREDEWTGLMRAALNGDEGAYRRLLRGIAPVLRALARRGLARAGQPVDQAEDIVQEILL